MSKDAPQATSAFRRFLRISIILLVAGCVYAIVIRQIGFNRIREVLSSARLDLVAAAAGVTLICVWGRVLKWRYALGANAHAVGVFFFAKAVGNYSPGRVGEFSPMLMRRHRTPKLGAWVLFDRVTEASVTLIFGFIGLLLSGIINRGISILLMIALILCLGFIFWAATRHQWLHAWTSKHPEGSRRKRFISFMAGMSEEIHILGAKAPIIAILSVLVKTADLITAMLLFSALGWSVGFWLLAAAKCAHAIVGTLSATPDITGVAYLASGGLLHALGGIPGDAVAVASGLEVLVTTAVFWASFVIGINRLTGKQ